MLHLSLFLPKLLQLLLLPFKLRPVGTAPGIFAIYSVLLKRNRRCEGGEPQKNCRNTPSQDEWLAGFRGECCSASNRGTTAQSFQYNGLSQTTFARDTANGNNADVTIVYDSIGRTIEEAQSVGGNTRYVTNGPGVPT